MPLLTVLQLTIHKEPMLFTIIHYINSVVLQEQMAEHLQVLIAVGIYKKLVLLLLTAQELDAITLQISSRDLNILLDQELSSMEIFGKLIVLLVQELQVLLVEASVGTV